nr:triphosphoribosyl-dephospho-CoA synthase [Pseudomonas aeruginosa]
MNAIANLAATLRADLGECLADLAVDALIDEAELSPKPALVDRRGNGAHADLHLGLMQASALSLWPCFKEMADAAQRHGRIDARLRGVLGQLGRDGEAAMLRTTEGVNTHRGAIWALGLLVAAAGATASAAPARRRVSASPAQCATACRSYGAAAKAALASRTPGSMRCWRS